MRKSLLVYLCLTVFFTSTVFAQNPKPFFRFNKILFSSKQDGPEGLGCINPVTQTPGMPKVFSIISGYNPDTSTSLHYGKCEAFISKSFPVNEPARNFRISFDQSKLTYYKKLNVKKSKTIYTGGKAFIEHRNSVDTTKWDTILKAGNFTVFLYVSCNEITNYPELKGSIIADILPGGDPTFVNEFKSYGGTNQIKALFIGQLAPLTPPLSDATQIAFKAVFSLEPMPKNGQADIQGLNVPGVGIPMNSPITGTTITFNKPPKVLGDTTNKPAITLCRYHTKDSIPSRSDTSLSSVFKNLWWLVGSNLDTTNFEAKVCFKFDPRYFGKNFDIQKFNKIKKYIRGCWQRDAKWRWKIAPKLDTINMADSTICFTIDHFSNWTIALDKPAPAKTVQTTESATGSTKQIANIDTTLGFSFRYNIPAGQTDTVLFEKYNIDPGGDLKDTNYTLIGDSYWDLQSSRSNTGTGSNLDGSVGFSIDTSLALYQTILYRPDAASDWEALPATRVKKGLKESMYVRPSNKSGQYAVAEAKTQTQEFTAEVEAVDVCKGDPTTFTITVKSGGKSPYAYYVKYGDGDSVLFDNVASTTFSTKHLYADSLKSYNSEIIVYDANMAQLDYYKTVNIVTKPKASFTSSVSAADLNQAVTFTSTSIGTGALTYFWDFKDGVGSTSTLANPTYSFKTLGAHSVKLVITSTTGGCRDSVSNSFEVTGINEDFANNSKLQIFPNPNSEKYINIRFTNVSSDQININVIDVIGKVVYSEQKNNFNGIYEKHLDLKNHPKGIYLVKISDGSTNYIQRVVLQ